MSGYRHPRTTDDWTREFFDGFAKDVDCHIRILTDLEGDQAYRLRRLIMISLRHGGYGVDRLTNRIDVLESELDRLKSSIKVWKRRAKKCKG